MVSALVRLHVFGDSYQEILDNALKSLALILDIEEDEVQDRINLELEISENEPTIGNDSAFRAEATARIRDDRG